jgi:hypothetical protein
MDRLAEYTRLPAVNFLPSSRMLGQAFSLGRNLFPHIADRQIYDEMLVLQGAAYEEMLESIHQQEARDATFLQEVRQQIAPIEPLRIIDAPRGSIDTTPIEPVETQVARIETSAASSSRGPGEAASSSRGPGEAASSSRGRGPNKPRPQQQEVKVYKGMVNVVNPPSITEGVVHFDRPENWALKKYGVVRLREQLRIRGYRNLDYRDLTLTQAINHLTAGDNEYFSKLSKSK